MQAQLIAGIAESHENLNAVRDLKFLPHQIASIAFRTGSRSGPDVYTSHRATAAALRIALHMAVQHHSLGRDTTVDGTVCTLLAQGGVFAAAVHAAQHGETESRIVALELLGAGLACGERKVHMHILGLGVVPLAWCFLLAAEDAKKGGGVNVDSATMFAEMASKVLEYVEGDRDAVAMVGAAGPTPLARWMLEGLGDVGKNTGEKDDGGSGLRRIDGDLDDGKGGSPAFLR
jgi:hypothetical protein